MPYTYLPDRGRGAHPRLRNPKGDAGRTPERPSAEAAPRPVRAVRPYLLKRFRERKTEELKSVTPQMFRTVRSDLKRHINSLSPSCRPHRPLPDRLDRSFMDYAADVLSEGCGGCTDIVEVGGRPHLLITTDADYWERGVQSLCLAGLLYMEDGEVKDAAEAFLREFITRNPFIPFSDSVWECLYDEVATNYRNGDGLDEDKLEFINASLEDIDDELKCKDILYHAIQHLKELPSRSCEELRTILDNTFPGTDEEKELLALLRTGLDFCYGKSWDDGDFHDDSYGYASVCIGPYDFFTVHWNERDPFYLGEDICGAIYDGDECVTVPTITLLLNGDGTLDDIYDRDSFSQFCSDLSDCLNKFRNSDSAKLKQYTIEKDA